ncbi:TetR/AcrR family transcriptional regulator [Acidocella sp. MX-AZ03]|nr:helix-turn-helix domain-containing protein [Acidocella sp. MX-AZ03]WBO61086.1 TetR/AcrR family transcriptional regulator [Acidocella sp. MX-AZ03]
MAAAEQLFLSKGYHNTTMADIARQAGMSKRTVYTLVPSKADLFGELMAHQRQTRLQFPSRRLAPAWRTRSAPPWRRWRNSCWTRCRLP